MAVTLEMVLAARDARQARQRELLAARPDCALVVLTVVVPGAEKRTADSLTIARAGVEALREAFGARIVYMEEADLATGYEAFLQVETGLKEAKRLTMEIEENHFLGRLFDMDVIGSDLVPVSRTQLGGKERRCLVCDDNSRVCMRLRRHSIAELTEKIHFLANEYLRRF